MLDALLYDAVSNTEHVNTLQLVFLVLEGCVCCSMAAIYLMYLLRSVANQRYTLYDTFLAIPIGLTRALATQSTRLDDGGSDDEEEEAVSQRLYT